MLTAAVSTIVAKTDRDFFYSWRNYIAAVLAATRTVVVSTMPPRLRTEKVLCLLGRALIQKLCLVTFLCRCNR
jgi:hypothetical protein